jgi:hypothetical protein
MLDMNESTLMDFRDEVKFAEFQVEKKLGAGAFAEVVLCEQILFKYSPSPSPSFSL